MTMPRHQEPKHRLHGLSQSCLFSVIICVICVSLPSPARADSSFADVAKHLHNFARVGSAELSKFSLQFSHFELGGLYMHVEAGDIELLLSDGNLKLGFHDREPLTLNFDVDANIEITVRVSLKIPTLAKSCGTTSFVIAENRSKISRTSRT